MSFKSQRAHETTASGPARRRACVFLSNPFTDCYCMNISGTKIPRMLDFCVGDFASCPVYRNRTSAGSPATGSGAAQTKE